MASNPGTHRQGLPAISVRRPVLAIVLNLLIVLAGVAAILNVPVRELPKIERPVASVNADLPGAAPETMDAEVTRILEGAAARVPGVTQISSASEEGTSRMQVEFDPAVDINTAANDLREAIASVEEELPAETENITVVKADDEAEPVIRLAARSDAMSQTDLTDLIQDRIAPALLSVPGVADVRLFGNRQQTLNLVIDQAALASHGLAVNDVADAVRNAGLDIPAGSVPVEGQNLLVRADATVVTEHRMSHLFIDDTTRIGDVANVFYGPAEATSYVRLNGERVIGLDVIRQAQANTIEISDGIDQVVERLNRELTGVALVETSDDAVYIRGAVQDVLLTLALGVAIVIGVILCFFGSLRLTLVPSVTIPVALIGTVAAIWLLGFSINILTLLALVLATGLVVDDAIVVLENIERVAAKGTRRLAAAVLGTQQVFFAVLATTATLASVFIPIALLPGRTGKLFTEFGFTLAIAVGLSSFVALSVVPMLASRLIDEPGEGRPPGPIRRGFVGVGSRLARLYEVVLIRLLRAPILTVGLALLIAAVVGSLFTSLDRELVPEEDRGVIQVWLQGPDGVNLDYSDRQVTKVENILQPLVDSGEATGILAIVGRYDLHRGYVVAPLAPWGERRSQQAIAAELKPKFDEIAGAQVRISSPNSLDVGDAGSEIEFAVTGSSYPEIAAGTRRLVDAIEARVPELRGVTMEYQTTQPELSVQIDRARASDLGIDIDGLATTLQAMVDGTEVTQLNVDDRSVPLRLESRFGALNDTDDLNNLYVATAGDRIVPLSTLVSFSESGAATELERYGQQRGIEVEANLAEGITLGEAVDRVAALADVLPQGQNLAFQGNADQLEQANRDALITFAIALLVVLLVLAAQFESFASAVVVMATVPFGLAAAVLSLWLTGTSLNVYSQIGLVMLIGLMAKNGILIVEFANQLRDRGRSVTEAAREAAVVRLRPVMMTMLSTTLAGIPLIVTGGPGAEARHAIGWTIFGGLGIAILATLIVTPVVYSLLAPLAKARGDFTRRLDRELAAAPDADARTQHG
ncbi:multidrug transporter AcrB [Rhodovibrio sodomensis]|uniref:Multidrug transporter AcrB n=1 Tax=Rhodovibrio sodomensis TaxID=1088 RepID=A0ABS1DIZ5_9PROT|nr:efflux RND transporter permease subunit [Rhodovibrio sodomensis]MBK1670273.1 multidrug transporter AcrB [Rhodovibrio sodomensis]